MKRAQVTLLLGSMMLSLSGCTSVVGKWSLSNVDPTAARRDFEYSSLTLQKDGSYYGEVQTPTPKTQSGTYEYRAGVLDLVAQNGERDTYDAKMLGANKLHLEKFWKGQKVKADFVRKE